MTLEDAYMVYIGYRTALRASGRAACLKNLGNKQKVFRIASRYVGYAESPEAAVMEAIRGFPEVICAQVICAQLSTTRPG